AATGNQIPVLNTGTLYLTGQVFAFGFSSIGSVQIGGGSATTTIQGTPTGTSTIQGFINVTGTNSTSTFSGNVSVQNLNVGGSATSTYGNGVNVAAGCFAVNGQCLQSGAQITSPNSWSQLQTFQSGIIAQASSTVTGNFTVSGILTTLQNAS